MLGRSIRTLIGPTTATTALALVGTVVTAAPALADIDWTYAYTITNSGDVGLCRIELNVNERSSVLGLFPEATYGMTASCDLVGGSGVAAQMLASADLYDASSPIATTGPVTCTYCRTIDASSSHTALIRIGAYRATGWASIRLNPSNGERFDTPDPYGCVVSNSGLQLDCSLDVYA